MRIPLITFIIAFALLRTATVKAQCDVTISAYPLNVCAGNAVTLSAAGACGYLLNNDFNSGLAGTGWTATTGVDFTNPCNSTSDGTTYMWMGSNVPIPRTLTTVAFDVTQACDISFDLKYATQSGASPCEGPDEMDEGITLQYSINNGTTWVDIAYFCPNGVIMSAAILPNTNNTQISNYNTPFTVWANYSFAIPAAAQTPATMFRWIQQAYTTQLNDHWGLDNCSILCPGNVQIQWNNGDTTLNPPPVYPTVDTWYSITIIDTASGLSATDSVLINVINVPSSDFTVTSPICSDNFSTVAYTGSASSTATFNWLFSGASVLSGSGAGPYNLQWPTGGTMWISLEVSDSGCASSTSYDTIVVYQTPTAEFTADDQEGCQPLAVNFSDLSNPAGSIWHWNFGDLGTSTAQNPSHTYNSEGMFDVSLIVTTPQGCTDTATYSDYIEVYDQPVANILATPQETSIADPVVTFSSSTSGVSDWFWSFGDGNTSLEEPGVSHAYTTDGVFNVMLIVSSDFGCVDTAYTTVTVIAEPEFYNVITPDGNGQNDFFQILNAERIPNKLIIFNRWGNKVFEAENYQNNWDGENLSDGTYFFIFIYGVDMENEYNGTVTIIRQ